MLKEQIDQNLKEALRSKDMLAADALRMLKARIKNEEIAKGKEFSDEDVLSVIASEVKKRKDSVTAYIDGGRPELAQKEQAEIDLLTKYLPEQLSEAEVEVIIDQTLQGQTLTAADFGKAMGMLMPKLKGKADGSVISKILKEKLK